MNTDDEFSKLRSLIEKSVGRVMKTPKDFDFLSKTIYARTHTLISSQTLKRFWGYLSAGEVRRSTLDLLSVFVGYTDFEAFRQNCEKNLLGTSMFLMQSSLRTDGLEVGSKVRILWNPDRCILVRYLGNCRFVVEESQNSKLLVGDRFCCLQIIDSCSLLLTDIEREGMESCNYICGKDGGVHYQVILD